VLGGPVGFEGGACAYLVYLDMVFTWILFLVGVRFLKTAFAGGVYGVQVKDTVA